MVTKTLVFLVWAGMLASTLVLAQSPDSAKKKGKTTPAKSKPTSPSTTRAEPKEEVKKAETSSATSPPASPSAATPPPGIKDEHTPPSPVGPAKPKPKPPEKKPAAVSSILPEEIAGFDEYPPDLQDLIRKSLALTTQNLRYQFGSSDPKAGGMDCSGTMYRVLTDSQVKDVPRQSDEFCRWVMRRTVLYRTENVTSLKDNAFRALAPGDLLFWTGTYEMSTPRDLPISHVMIYLGKRKKDGKPVVFGASDGRTYEGQRRNGVSVFDFNMPKRGDKAAFYGYGPVPGLDLQRKAPPEPSKPANPA